MKSVIYFFVLLQVLRCLGTRCRYNDIRGTCVHKAECDRYKDRITINCGSSGLSCCPPVTSEVLQSYKYPQDCGQTPWLPYGNIVGGRLIPPVEFPWLASLEYKNRPNKTGICAGSVINIRYVLTAAHCVTGRQIDASGGVSAVRLGNLTVEHPCDYGTTECQIYQRFGVEKVIPHEGYDPDLSIFKQNMHYDIALIRLDRVIRFDAHLKPVCLPFGIFSTGEPVAGDRWTPQLSVAGWGLTLNTTDELPAKRMAQLPLWTRARCLENVRRNSKQLCAGIGGKGSCNGDSGGPLMQRKQMKTRFDRRMVLEGIVSYGTGVCANPNDPSVFTRVRSYREWIDFNMSM